MVVLLLWIETPWIVARLADPDQAGIATSAQMANGFVRSIRSGFVRSWIMAAAHPDDAGQNEPNGSHRAERKRGFVGIFPVPEIFTPTSFRQTGFLADLAMISGPHRPKPAGTEARAPRSKSGNGPRTGHLECRFRPDRIGIAISLVDHLAEDLQGPLRLDLAFLALDSHPSTAPAAAIEAWRQAVSDR